MGQLSGRSRTRPSFQDGAVSGNGDLSAARVACYREWRFAQASARHCRWSNTELGKRTVLRLLMIDGLSGKRLQMVENLPLLLCLIRDSPQAHRLNEVHPEFPCCASRRDGNHLH